MSKLRRQLSAGIANNVETKSLDDLKSKTGNLYAVSYTHLTLPTTERV